MAQQSPGTGGQADTPAQHPVPIRQFILKTHSRCNLACTYCYLYAGPDHSWRDRPRTPAAEVTEQAARRIAEHAAAHGLREVSVVLHGGEPLLAGAERLSADAELIRRAMPAGCTAHLSLQTNATLLTADRIAVLRRAGIGIGVSLDGGLPGHNRARTDHAGRPAWPAAAAGVRRLAESAPELYGGVLCVVDLRLDPVEVYESLLGLRPPMIDLLLPHGNWTAPPPGLPAGPDAPAPYGRWLTAVFDRWWGDVRRRTRIKLFEECVALLLGVPAATERLGLQPFTAVVVETDGAVEQVDSLKSAYEGAAATGLDVFRHTFDDALRHPGLAARQAGLAALSATCRACPLVHTCGGGHYAHRYRAPAGFRHPSVYCADLAHLIRHITISLATAAASAGQKGAEPVVRVVGQGDVGRAATAGAGLLAGSAAGRGLISAERAAPDSADGSAGRCGAGPAACRGSDLVAGAGAGAVAGAAAGGACSGEGWGPAAGGLVGVVSDPALVVGVGGGRSGEVGCGASGVVVEGAGGGSAEDPAGEPRTRPAVGQAVGPAAGHVGEPRTRPGVGRAVGRAAGHVAGGPGWGGGPESGRRITDRALGVLGRTGSDAQTLRVLVAGQRRRRLVLLRALWDAVGEAGRGRSAAGGAEGFAAGWGLLEEAERAGAGQVRRVLHYPFTGAWAERCLRGLGREERAGETAAALSWLAAVGAAAAARAGLAFTIEVPLHEGRLTLPTLGSYRMAGPARTARVTGDGGRLRLHAEPGHLVEVRRGPDGIWRSAAPGWRPLRELRTPGGHPVLVDDADPYRREERAGAPYGLVVAEGLDGEAHAVWRRAWQEAEPWLRLGDGGRAREVEALLACLVPLSSTTSAEHSATMGDAFGALLSSTPVNGLRLAGSLVHELQHTKLLALSAVTRLHTADATARYWAPWRTDPRPFDNVFQGAYAHLALADFHLSVAHAAGSPAVRDSAWAAHCRCRQQVEAVLPQLLGARTLTPKGRTLVNAMAAHHTRLKEHTPPDGHLARATAYVETRRVLWRRARS